MRRPRACAYSPVNNWTEAEVATSSTWRESQTILLFLQIHAKKIQNSSLKWYSDNQAVPSILHKGSMKQDLNICAMGIFQLCLEFNIQLSVDWVPRENNVVADSLSKLVDTDDWAIAKNIFAFLSQRYGPFSIDLFASSSSKQLDRFYSRFWCPGSLGVDSFAYNWANEHCWVVPPPKLVPRVLTHMKTCKTRGLMIVPRWQSAMF